MADHAPHTPATAAPVSPSLLWQAAKSGHVRKLGELVERKVAENRTPNNWLLHTILAVFRHKNPERREQMIRLLAPHWEWGNHGVGVRRATLDNALHEGAFECIPQLHQIGYSLRHDSGQANFAPSARAGRGLMAACLGQGDWPYPDLLCPDLFTQSDAPQMLAFWADHLVNWKGDRWPKRELIGEAHAARMATLLIDADPTAVRQAVAQAFARSVCHPDGWRQLKTVGKLEEGMGRLMAYGWMGEVEFEDTLAQAKSQRNPVDSKAVDTLRRLFVGARTWAMEVNTHAIGTRITRGLRL